MEMGPLLAETYRLGLLRGLEEMLQAAGMARVAGVDEAGRGALAGPVVAAAVIMDPGCSVPGVDDSKLLSAPQRERLAAAIRRAALAVAVASVAADEIDRSDIRKASRRAMTTALGGLWPPPDCALVDAERLDGLPFPCLGVVRGDRISYAVACASIVAKVERDRAMTELGRRFPHFGFAEHKGYGAADHREALARFGPSPCHRLTFRSVVPRAGDGGVR